MKDASAGNWDNPKAEGIKLVGRTALKRAEPAPLPPRAADDRRTQEERQQAAEEAETLSVALEQRTRLGAKRDQKRVESALGRFCAFHQPVKLGNHCFLAGARYGRLVRGYKVAKGYPILGQQPSSNGADILTEAQREAQRQHDIMAWQDANATLRGIHPRAPVVMERLCYDELDPSPYDGGIIVNALMKFSLEWGFLVPYERREASE